MKPRGLTEAKQRRPYAQYYFRPMAEPNPELLQRCTHRLPAEQVLKPENVQALFAGETERQQLGWSILPDGAGYVAARVEMPGVTPKMIAWWFAWYPLESLRYMLWYPGRHFSASLSVADRQRLLDPSVPLSQKLAGVTHIIQEDSREREDLTAVPPPFSISFRFPDEMGIRPEWIGFPEHGCAVLASPPLNEDGSLPDRSRIMLHYARAEGNGVVFCSRFWMGGYVLRGGQAEYTGVGTPTPADAPSRLLLHCVREYTNLASFLPELYQNCQGRIEP